MFSNFYRAVKKKLKERMDDFQVLCSFGGKILPFHACDAYAVLSVL